MSTATRSEDPGLRLGAGLGEQMPRVAGRLADRRPTLDDVAALAGVSRMVASRAIRESGSVSEDAADRVRVAVERLGYVVHQGARSLATNRTGAVAFIAPMSSDRFFGDPNVAEILRGIKSGVRDADQQLVTLLVEEPQDAVKVAAFVKGRHVDGVVVLSPELIADLVRDLAAARVPIAANGLIAGAPRMDSLTFDPRGPARELANLIRGHGATQVAVIAGGRSAGTQRFLDGVESILGPLPDDHIEHTDHSFEQGDAAAERLLERMPGLDALIAASDVSARAAIAVLARHGRRVPEDVPVTGWDNSLPVESGAPGITTVDIPFRAIGEELAAMVLEQIAGEPGGRIRPIATALVRRTSA